MDNFFIAQYFDWSPKRVSYLDRLINKALRTVGLKYRLFSAKAIDELAAKIRGRRVYPLESGAMGNVEQRMNMYHLVSQVLAFDVEGELVELGCHEGRCSILIQKLIEESKKPKTLHLYDSFEGLPPSGAKDGSSYTQGMFKTSENIVIGNFKKYNLRLPEIHKGFFHETLPDGLPEKICFAYLDGDWYDSILISLKYVYPRLTRGAICLVDDYCDPEINPNGWNQLPGVKKACDEFLAGKQEKIVALYAGSRSHGYFRKS